MTVHTPEPSCLPIIASADCKDGYDCKFCTNLEHTVVKVGQNVDFGYFNLETYVYLSKFSLIPCSKTPTGLAVRLAWIGEGEG